MMKLEDVIEIFGTSMNKHLVLRRVELKEDKTVFKGVKTYRLQIWDANTPAIVCQVSKTCFITIENKSSVVGELEKELLKLMFESYGTK